MHTERCLRRTSRQTGIACHRYMTARAYRSEKKPTRKAGLAPSQICVHGRRKSEDGEHSKVGPSSFLQTFIVRMTSMQSTLHSADCSTQPESHRELLRLVPTGTLH